MPGNHVFCPVCQRAKELSVDGHEIHLGLELRIACDLSLFSLHYQPQFDLKTGAIIGAEALLRCNHDPLAHVETNRLIQMAEHFGLIQNIGCWAFEESCRQLRVWLNAGYEPICIAVNVSAIQLVSDFLKDNIPPILERYDIPAELIEIEVTETQPIFGDLRCLEALEALRNMGLRLAIDDFGTGYSSLSYLKRLKVHKLKIDRSFIQHLQFSSDDRLIVSSVIGLGRSLGIHVLAEGVETEEQATYLMNNGCGTVQGYLYGKPVAADTFEALHMACSQPSPISIPV